MTDGQNPLGKGDFVRHAILPHSPVMLVIARTQVPGAMALVACQWFTPDGHFHTGQFPPEFLTRAEPPSPTTA